MDIKRRLEKLQALPEGTKKIILWSIVVVLAVVMGFFLIKNAANNFSKIGESISNMELPQFDLSDMPQIVSPSDQDIIK